MKKYNIGEFEEIVMLTVGVLHGKAYGVAIKDEIESRLNRKVSVGALQSALRRLEEKAYLRSQRGEATPLRGGKPKRYFTLTAYGKKALEHVRDVRTQLWESMPDVALDFSAG